MEIGGNLHRNLVTLISNEVNIAETYEGRDVLLTGIYNQNGWKRSQDKRIDLFKIIDHLRHHFIGEEEIIQNWGLLIFIGNAIHETVGTTTAKKLQGLRDQCIQCWKQEQHERVLGTSDNVNTNEQMRPLPSKFEQALFSESEPSQLEDTECLEVNLSPNFFDNTVLFMCLIYKYMELAEIPFKPPLDVSDLVKRRIALRHLENVLLHLRQLDDYMKKASVLPEIIVEKRHVLRNHIYYLIEKIQSLQDLVDTCSGAYQIILESFEEIKRGLVDLHLLKGEGSIHQ